MIEGYLPGLVRVDPVGVAPAEVVRLAARCELLEAVAEAAADLSVAWSDTRHDPDRFELSALSRRLCALDAALVAAGATGKAGT